MSEIVNLRHARKQKARSEAEAKATENRAQHGRTKAQKALAEAERRRAAQILEGHKRADDDE
jgi:hypothetical protein